MFAMQKKSYSGHIRKLLSISTFVLLLGVGCVSVDIDPILFPELSEYSIQPSNQRTRGKILIIDITGTIKSGSKKGFNLLSTTTPDQVKSILDKAI